MFISFEEFKNMPEYNQFISQNPDVGYVKVQVFTAYEAIPITDTQILITKKLGDKRVIFFEGKTDSSGIISDIALPAPVTVPVGTPDVVPEYETYDLTAVHAGYETIKQFVIGVFGDVKIIQYVKMAPEIKINGVVGND